MDGPGVPPFSWFDFLRGQALVFDELRRIQSLLAERLLQRDEPPPGEPPRDGDSPPEELLRRLQHVLLEHPLAAQAAFSALVAEGRRFAATPEGAACRDALASSALMKQGRQLWDALALNLLEENPSTVVPSMYLEAFFQAARTPELDALLRTLRTAGTRDGHGAP